MTVQYEGPNGVMLDADGRRIEAAKPAVDKSKIFKVTYEGPDGRERYPDGSLVDRTPVDRNEVTAPYTPTSVQGARSINPEFVPSQMSPGELAYFTQRELIDAGDDLVPEDRDKLHAMIKQDAQDAHMQDQIDSGVSAVASPPPPTWGSGNQQTAQIMSDDEQDLGTQTPNGVSVSVPPALKDEENLTPAEKRARTLAAKKAAAQAAEEDDEEDDKDDDAGDKE